MQETQKMQVAISLPVVQTPRRFGQCMKMKRRDHVQLFTRLSQRYTTHLYLITNLRLLVTQWAETAADNKKLQDKLAQTQSQLQEYSIATRELLEGITFIEQHRCKVRINTHHSKLPKLRSA